MGAYTGFNIKVNCFLALMSSVCVPQMALTPPALAQQHTLDEFTQYQEMIKERTGGSLPTVQSYKSPVVSETHG